jgi:6-phosphogluconate dehydrogenase (decarboxylating)
MQLGMIGLGRKGAGMRFQSRDEIEFSAMVAAALREQFGGHAVKALEEAKAGSDPR